MSMDVEASVPLTPVVLQKQDRPATMLCCNCGTPIDGTSDETYNALCQDCLKLEVDISEGIQREGTLHTCRDCDRWFSPPSQWVIASPESRELLALCLRKLRGLSKVRIIDASFTWTEPHSRRVKVKITIQQEAGGGTILQQTFEVEFVVAYYQCPDCAKSYTHNTWRASVQVRQKVPHKRTFLYLEQLILKNSAHKDTINIREDHNGLDFFFSQRNHAEKFVDFLSSVTPCRVKKSQTLISMDIHTSTKSYKFSFSVELLPICKDDLVALPIKLAKQLGNISPLTLCYRVGTSVNVLDPQTLQTSDITTAIYWRTPFPSLADVRTLTEFMIMDIEPLGVSKGRFLLAEATVRRTADLGVNDTEYTIRTHLGSILHPGDTAMGYHMTGTNFNSPELEAIERSKGGDVIIPDVVLVKKVFPRRTKKGGNKSRNWKLKRMARQQEEDERKTARAKMAGDEDADYEMFLRDVEEDEEMRAAMNLYKSKQEEQQRRQQTADDTDGEMEVDEEGSIDGSDGEEHGEDEDDGLEVPMDQLREEFEDMNVED